MLVSKLDLKISSPTGPISPGRGFYQLEDETLFVQIGNYSSNHRFFSFLESPKVRFDLDRTGNLLFIEIDCPRRSWEVDNDFKIPNRIEPADIKWFDFRRQIIEPKIITNHNKNALKLEYHQNKQPLYYYLAKDVIVECDSSFNFCGIWILNIIDDLAGREIRNFRLANRNNNNYFI